MLRRVLGLIGVVLAIGLGVGLLAGCGGPPDFKPAPGKVRASPLPAGQGEVSYPANVTVDGTALFVFTHGVRHLRDGGYQVNLSAIPNPSAERPGDTAAQAWLGEGDAMEVAGLRVEVLAIYPGGGESGSADVQVTRGTAQSSEGPSDDVS